MVDPATIVALITGIGALGTFLFAAMNRRRDDSTALISQQSLLVADMKVLHSELEAALARARSELLAAIIARDKATESLLTARESLDVCRTNTRLLSANIAKLEGEINE